MNPVTVDGEGNYTIPNVKLPYSVKFDIRDSKDDAIVNSIIVEGVENSNLNELIKPILDAMTMMDAASGKPAKISGNLLKKDNKLDSMLFLSDEKFGVSTGQPVLKNPTTDTFEYLLSPFPFSQQGSGVLYAFQVSENLLGSLNTFNAYGRRVIDSIPQTGNLDGQDITLEPINSKDVKVKISLPADADSSLSNFWSMGFRDTPNTAGITLAVGPKLKNGENIIPMPNIKNANYFIDFETINLKDGTENGIFKSFKDVPDSIALDTPKAIKINEPKDGSIVSASSVPVFRWSTDPGLYMAYLHKSTSGSGDQVSSSSVVAMTYKNEFDFNGWGIKLEPKTQYSMSLTRFSSTVKLNSPLLASPIMAHSKDMWSHSSFEYNIVRGKFSTAP